MTEINKNLYWRDGLHLQKKGCNMLASIYANKICNALKEKIYHHLHQPSKETSTPPMPSSSSSSSCSYIHISPQPTTPQNFAVYHRCHNRPKFKRRRLSKPANMETSNRSERDVNDSDFVENVSNSNFNVDCVKKSSVSCHGCVIPFMFSMLFAVRCLLFVSCGGWDGETIGICQFMNVKGIFCELLRPVDMQPSTSLLCETLPLKWNFISYHFRWKISRKKR